MTRKDLCAISFLLLMCIATGWFACSPQVEVMVARNLLLYRGERFWRAIAPTSAPALGDLRGTVRDGQGQPVSGALIIAADANGRTFTSESDGAGQYHLRLLAGAYAPMATKAGYDDARLQFGPLARTIVVAGNETIASGDFTLRRAPLRAQAADASLQFFDEAIAHTNIPQAADVRRRGFTFVRASTILTGSYVYEPLTDGRYPLLLFIYPCWVYPCSTLGWDLLSATMAAKGFVVVAFSPQRGTDLEADVADVLQLIAHVKAGQLSTKGDASQLALAAGSLTSIHLWRVAQLAPCEAIQAIVVLGGISDLFLVRQRFEANELLLEPPFAAPLSTALIGLGRPNLNPDLYVRYSPVYHLDARPRAPIALIHGGSDKTVPYEQTPHFAEWLRARGIPHTMYLYPHQEHYLDLTNINAAELDMLDKVVGFLHDALQ